MTTLAQAEIVAVAEWLACRSGKLSDPSLGPPAAAADFSVIAEWPKNTHMLTITLPRAGNMHRRA